MTTLREAISAATTDHGEDSLWSDGGTDWRLDLYIEATEDAERDSDAETSQLDEPAYYDGRTIRLYRADGTIDTGEALLAIRSTTPDTITTEQIEALRREAGEAGDLEQVAICDKALAGSKKAIAECARVIADAEEAQAD